MIVTIWLVVPGVLSSEKMIHYGWIGGLLGAWIGGGTMVYILDNL